MAKDVEKCKLVLGRGGENLHNTKDEVGAGRDIKMHESSHLDWKEARDGD